MCSCFYKPKLSDADSFSLKILRPLLTHPIPPNTCKQALLFFLYVFFTLITFAQQKITGVVTGVNDAPLSGATITVKGSKIIGATNAEGVFVVNAKHEDILIISFVGYTSQQVKVGKDSYLKISLALSVNDLDQVIVTGYTSQKIKKGSFCIYWKE